ncbi:MAG: hypothetical protein FWD06_09075, partial [Oscillospiraceae bacterium]|nr:hypothetical protein [Oscillospiraceae bacterium]
SIVGEQNASGIGHHRGLSSCQNCGCFIALVYYTTIGNDCQYLFPKNSIYFSTSFDTLLKEEDGACFFNLS